jgi:hypothetical protein
MRAAALVFLLLFSVNTSAVIGGARQSVVVESSALRSIAAWLKEQGQEGFLGADVADALGIARLADEELLSARQRGYRSEGVLRMAQLSADEKRDFLLFMVQRPDGQVFFYLSSVSEGLKRAFVSIPERNLVQPLERGEAEASFLREVLYWEDKVAVR